MAILILALITLYVTLISVYVTRSILLCMPLLLFVDILKFCRSTSLFCTRFLVMGY